MRTRRTVPAALIAWAALLGAASAQTPPMVGAPPAARGASGVPGRGPSPFLFVRFAGPQGMAATFYQGRPEGRSFDGPVAVGLRPGYIYRVRLSGFADHPGLAIYPTLEVRGTLFLPPRVGPADYPAPVVLTEADLRSALAGSLVTKVIYLEDPDKAVPAATPASGPNEADLPPGRDPLDEARDLGRPMVVVRFGGRVPPPEELVYGSVPGTILMPGDQTLPLPRIGPCLPWTGCGFFDPIIGPRPPTEECFHDGGDHGLRAGIGPDGKLHGLDAEDTVGEYTDPAGQRRVVPSNEVCLCSPRFGVLRTECPLGRYEAAIGVGDTHSASGQTLLEQGTPSVQNQQYAEMKAIISREKPSGELSSQGVGRLVRVDILEGRQLDLGPAQFLCRNGPQQLTEAERTRFVKEVEFALSLSQPIGVSGLEEVVGTAALARVEGKTDVVSSTLETRDFTICCNEPHPVPPDRPLLLTKCADRQSARPGEVVTFILRYSNHGGRPLTDVAVSDSLSARLEYVPGSAQADRDAVFTTEQNEAGSVILRWEISGRLAPGDSGVLKFQAKVR